MHLHSLNASLHSKMELACYSLTSASAHFTLQREKLDNASTVSTITLLAASREAGSSMVKCLAISSTCLRSAQGSGMLTLLAFMRH